MATRASRKSRGKGRSQGATAHALPSPISPEAAGSREQFVAEARSYFALLTRPLIDMRTPATGGREFALKYTRMVDAIVALLFQRAVDEHGLALDEIDISVVALGGYGRAEMAPFSDVDLFITCGRKTPLVEAVTSAFIRYMWDIGFELGHAVESLIEADEAITRDMDMKTSLIESRWVCGSKRVAKALDKRIGRMRRHDREEFLRRKISDALARYEKFGRSYQLIEPDVKSSPGGLRDYQTLVWLGSVGRLPHGLAALRRKGLLLPGERRELEEAYDFLLRVRAEMHIKTASKQDVLTVAAQQEVAKALGYTDQRHHLAVESFMREYYRHTRTIHRVMRDCVAALDGGSQVGVLLGQGKIARDTHHLSVPLRPKLLHERPLYVFEKQKKTGQKLERSLRRRLEVAQAELDGAAVVRACARRFRPCSTTTATSFAWCARCTRRAFSCASSRSTTSSRASSVTTSTITSRSTSTASRCWAFSPSSAHPKARRSPASRWPGSTRSCPTNGFSFWPRCCTTWARSRDTTTRSRAPFFPAGSSSRWSFRSRRSSSSASLIENHLVMSHFSQRRDPSDLGTITAFCDRVRTRQRLKYLCLLTYADYRATSPLVWNEWKRTLLWELYVRAYDFMARREKQPREVYQQHKEHLLDAFPEGEERAARAGAPGPVPGGYLLTMSADLVRDHIRMIAQLGNESVVVGHRYSGSAHEITFCTQDKPYRLSELCGVLALNDFTILNAFAFTRKDGKVVDVFVTEPVDRGDLMAPEETLLRIEHLRANLKAVLPGRWTSTPRSSATRSAGGA